jgi:hypothetical protein
MMRLSKTLRAFALTILSVSLLTVTASAAEVRVMISGGLAAAYKALIKFLASPAARAEIIKSGLDPIPAGATN